MKTILLLEKLKQKSTFTIQDIERITYCSHKYAKVIASRLKKRNYIKQVKKNVYTMNDDIFTIATNIIHPSYLSFWSASYFLGYTEQIVNTIQIATTVKLKPIKFDNYTIRFIPIKNFFGYKKIKTQNGDLFCVENEKLLIDCITKSKECGNFDEITKIFENTENVSEKKIVEYLKRINNQTVIKRVGFLLKKIRKIDILKKFSLDKNYPILNPFTKKWKSIDKNWRLKI